MFIFIPLFNYRTLNLGIVINNFQELLLYEMDLIAQLLLESRTGAYLEWLANEVIMTAN